MARLFSPMAQEPKSEVITASRYWVAPAGVTKVNLSGYGGRGNDAYDYYVEGYDTYQVTHQMMRDPPYTIDTTRTYTGFSYGATPANYCNPTTERPAPSYYQYTQTCFEFMNASYWENEPATTGSSSSAVNKIFPGSTGNVQPATTVYNDVAVTPGTSYYIYVPYGGQVVISYVE